ncbi:META domain-containing protein [Phormidium yuhuli AB48]|uniref:META domain-containing protein n=1 Tax=Phormidium yuhuli AB48 TaxID=2940671 RepID=A0ABY5ASW9_9CYAN|nr:META domain-containing protein [Phormidium yuhuli]USR92011.1 META domain-containing protein [Phormidium yuhuli AB48]
MSHSLLSLAVRLTGATLATLAVSSSIPLSLASVPLSSQHHPASRPPGQWQLRYWNQDPLNPELPSISLEINDDEVRGSAGCNHYFGSIERDGGRHFSLGPLASTRRGCEVSLMEREYEYLQALGAVQKYGFTPDGNLWLAYDSQSGTGTLEFSQVEGS